MDPIQLASTWTEWKTLCVVASFCSWNQSICFGLIMSFGLFVSWSAWLSVCFVVCLSPSLSVSVSIFVCGCLRGAVAVSRFCLAYAKWISHLQLLTLTKGMNRIKFHSFNSHFHIHFMACLFDSFRFWISLVEKMKLSLHVVDGAFFLVLFPAIDWSIELLFMTVSRWFVPFDSFTGFSSLNLIRSQ